MLHAVPECAISFDEVLHVLHVLVHSLLDVDELRGLLADDFEADFRAQRLKVSGGFS